MSLSKYLAATHNVESVDATSFNSFLTLIFVLFFGQSLSTYFILQNSIIFMLPFYALLVIAIVFMGIFRFRLSLVRSEVLRGVQIVLCQLIIVSTIILAYSLLHSNSFLIRLLFLAPMFAFLYSSELQIIRSTSVYTDQKYIQIQCSYIRLLFQGAVILFFINLTFTNSDLSSLFKERFDSNIIYYVSLTLFVFIFQVCFIILSNIYIKFQPLKDYATIFTNVKMRTVYSFVVLITLCGLKAFNVF